MKFFLAVVLGLVGIGPLVARAQTATAEPKIDPRLVIPSTDKGMPGAGPVRREPWFRDQWRNRRRTFAEREGREHGAVVFLGDSITQGWGDDFRGAFSPMPTANRGISGDTTRGMLYRLPEDVLALDPSGVVMLMGTNDIGENAKAETIVGNVKLIIKELKEHDPAMPIVLCQVMPSSPVKTRPADKIKELNRQLVDAMKSETGVTVVDTWTLFANESGDAKQEEFPDLLHPNQAGYEKWLKAIKPVLETLGLMPVPADDFVTEPGFVALFNGKDLTGWGVRPTSATDLKSIENWKKADPSMPPWPVVETAVSLAGKNKSPDGRYIAKNGRIVVTTPVEGRRIQKLWTEREFPKDFVLRLEFRATPHADSGIFIREPQLQCRDYLLAGPYTKLKNYKPQDWNTIEVTVVGGKARATCNGEVIEEAMEVPASGPIGLEGDRGQLEFRRIRVKEGK